MKTRKIRISMPSSVPGGVADVVDAETGEPLACRSFDLHADVDRNVILKLELIQAEAQVVLECYRLAEEGHP